MWIAALVSACLIGAAPFDDDRPETSARPASGTLGRFFRRRSKVEKPAATVAKHSVDPALKKVQGPPPPRPPALPVEDSASPASPPLPNEDMATSGPVAPPRPNPTAAPLNSNREGAGTDLPTMRAEDFERIALASNPTLVQAAAVVGVSRGRAWQAGLFPNPLIGYQGEHMGAQGSGSRHGPAALGEHQALFVQQEIPTAGRRQVSRTKFEWEAESAMRYADAQRFRVLNSVRIHFFEALGDQRLIEIRKELFKIADAGLRTTEEMINDGQASAPDLLQAQVQQQQAKLEVIRAENRFRQSWVSLLAEAGTRGHAPVKLEGGLDAAPTPLDFDALLNFIQAESPEVKAATAEIKRDETVVYRERIQPIPNIYVKADVGPNFIDGGTTASLSVWGNIPVWNKNQGTIYQANSHLEQANANLRRVRLTLEQRLAEQAASYDSASAMVRTYRDESLPRMKKAYDLLGASDRRGRAAWPQVLVAQRMWFEPQTEYAHALVDLRKSEIQINGFL